LNRIDKQQKIGFSSYFSTNYTGKMSSPGKKYAYLVVLAVWFARAIGDSVVQIKRVEDRFVPYEFSVSTRMIIVLDGQYNPNSSKAIEATSIQSPFDRKPPNLHVPYINRINIP
jgi:hypothetical protein